MHTDAELLGLLALGEQVGTEDDRVHLQTCAACAGELAELRRVVSLGRQAGTTLVVPSDDVWARIRDELAIDPSLEPPAHRSASATRHAPWSLLAGITAALGGGTQAADDEVRAHARLTPVEPSWSDASGTAELATDEHGRRLVQVALHADLPTSGLRQAWLVHRHDPSLRQSLGILDGLNGLWTVAHSIDLEKFAILDISQQRTGETEHSGRTIVRGELTLVS